MHYCTENAKVCENVYLLAEKYVIILYNTKHIGKKMFT